MTLFLLKELLNVVCRMFSLIDQIVLTIHPTLRKTYGRNCIYFLITLILETNG